MNKKILLSRQKKTAREVHLSFIENYLSSILQQQ